MNGLVRGWVGGWIDVYVCVGADYYTTRREKKMMMMLRERERERDRRRERMKGRYTVRLDLLAE